MLLSALMVMACLPAPVAWLAGRRRHARLRSALQQAAAARDELQRTARLVGLDLRDAALRLHGQTVLLRSAPDAAGGAQLSALAERCRLLADDLAAAGDANFAPILREETIDVLECARAAAAATAALIAPGSRTFRLPPPGAVELVRADRRALRQVLGRVLAEAALNTRQADAISLTVEQTLGSDGQPGALVLVISDEGSGVGSVATDEDAEVMVRDSRGVGASLALSRALMEAHGGALHVMVAAGTGTRVSLVFPVCRRRRSAAASTTFAIRAMQPY